MKNNNYIKDKIAVILLVIVLFLSLYSCGDTFSGALLSNTLPTTTTSTTTTTTTTIKTLKESPDVSNFVSVVGTSSIYLSWINPTSSSFSKVVLIRKTGSFADSSDDALATTVYNGTDTQYTDNSVATGQTYYYSIYTVSIDGVYSSNPAKSIKSMVSFSKNIRQRCIYLVGGSSSYSDPFNNLITEIDAFDPYADQEATGDVVLPNVATLPTPRYGCSVASVNGKIYVFGGLDSNKDPVSTVDVLDINSPTWPNNVWSTATSMEYPRYSLRTETINNKIYVFGGALSYKPFVFAQMTKANNMYDPLTNTWDLDENHIPNLYYEFMNFGSGAYDDTIVYGIGRYNGSPAFLRYIYVLNVSSNHSQQVAINQTPYGESASVLYHKDLTSDGSSLSLYFMLGGSTENSTEYEPIKWDDGTYMRTTGNCYYVKMPNTTLSVVNMGAPLALTPTRAYAQAEYYGNYIYVFCGVEGSNPNETVLNKIQRLKINDDVTFGSWETITTGGDFKDRFAFDLCKVNL